MERWSWTALRIEANAPSATGIGTMKGRADALYVTGRYVMRWADYSRLPGGGRGAELRRLVIEIAAAA